MDAYLPVALQHGDAASNEPPPVPHRCLGCGRTVDLHDGDGLPRGDEHCSHEWEVADADAADPQEPAWVPPGTPRCSTCHCVLMPHSLACPLCDSRTVDDTPIEISEEGCDGDPLSLDGTPF